MKQKFWVLKVPIKQTNYRDVRELIQDYLDENDFEWWSSVVEE